MVDSTDKNIVNFFEKIEKTEKLIWMCTSCDNCSFKLYDDLSIQCAKCDEFQEDTGHHKSVERWTRKE